LQADVVEAFLDNDEVTLELQWQVELF